MALITEVTTKLEDLISRLPRVDEAVFVFLYKIVLDLTYVFIQATVFGYYGFGYQPTVFSVISGWLFFLLGYAIIRDKRSDVCSLFLYTLFLVGIVPQIAYYQFNAMCLPWMILLQIACLALFKILFSIRNERSNRASRGISYKSRGLRMASTLILALYFVTMLYLYGLPSVDALSFYEIHNVRASARDTSTLFAIGQNIICKILCPFFMLIAFKERKWAAFVFALVIQLYSYSVTGFKTFLFIPLLLLCAQLIPSRNLKGIIVVCLPFVLAAVVLAYLATDEVMIYALLGNRVFHLPAEIKCYYFDYFSKHDFIFFSQNTIASIMGVTSSYTANIPNVIGTLYFDKPEMWANTGFLADGYANMGFAGMILVTFIVAGVMICSRSALENVSANLQKELQALFLLYFISLNDGGAISVLFSGGLLIVVFLIYAVDFGADCESDDSKASEFSGLTGKFKKTHSESK